MLTTYRDNRYLPFGKFLESHLLSFASLICTRVVFKFRQNIYKIDSTDWQNYHMVVISTLQMIFSHEMKNTINIKYYFARFRNNSNIMLPVLQTSLVLHWTENSNGCCVVSILFYKLIYTIETRYYLTIHKCVDFKDTTSLK